MKLDKHEVRRPDAFLQFSDRIGIWLSKNRKAVIGTGVALVVAGTAYGIFDFYNRGREAKAQEALYSARKLYHPAVADPFQAKPNAEAKLTEEAMKAFDSVMTQYGSTQAARVAAIELSQALLDENKKEEALKVFDKAGVPSAGDLVGSLFLIQKAKVLEANGKCQDALGILEKVWTNKSILKTLQTEARLRAGICYEQLSQLDKAKEMFTLAGQEKGAAADTAKKYLRLIQPNAS